MRPLLIPALLAVSLWPEGSAPVVVDAAQDAKGMQRFSVRAFGRSYQRTTSIKVSMGFASSGQVRSKYVVLKESGTIEVKDQLLGQKTP